MEAFAYTDDLHSMNTQNYHILLKQAIRRIDQTEMLLQKRVNKEIESIILKHAQIQNELNK